MMKRIFGLLFAVLLVAALAACGGKEEDTLVVGATNKPHAEILEKAKPLLEEKGIKLKIETFSKYELVNPALDKGDLDANYFQHIPYLENQVKEHGYDIVNAGGIHIEPIGIYSKKYKSLDEIEDGATVIMSSSVADHGRVLALFEANGLIKLREGIDKVTATLEDIVENPKNLQFNYEYGPEMLPTIFNNNEGDLVVINSNYALDAGLNPIEDSIAIEDENSPYVNIIAVRSEDKDREEIKTLVEVLRSKEIQDFILEEYGGAVVPVSE